MPGKSLYEIQTFNDALESENRIHSDEVAAQFGFEGALVAGVVVFGHMSYLPIKTAGANWLTNNTAEVRFLKPAYDGQLLTIEHDEGEGSSETKCINPEKTLLATLSSKSGSVAASAALDIAPSEAPVTRQEISWGNLHIDKAAPAYRWKANYEENLKLTEQIEDDLPLYRGDGACVHPFWLLRQCNSAFARSFILPAWMHVGSKMIFHRPILTGEEVETRMVPIKKWERKGHQFTTLYVPFLVGGELRVEVEHTSIFRIAPPDYKGD